MNFKSQITLFIILGIIILFISGMLYFFLFKNSKNNNTAKISASEDVLLAKEKYNAYVRQCVEESAKEGIYLIGLQGGVIYDYQAPGGKKSLGPPNYNYGKYVFPIKDENGIIQNVSYGIKNSVIDDYHPDMPLYPYGYVKLISDPQLYDLSYINPFGNSPQPGPFTPLCDYNGENSPKRSNMNFACDSYDAASPVIHNSVQEYLEAYIAAKTERCLDFSVYSDIPKNGISKGKALVNVTFSDNYINVDVSYPINISYKDMANLIMLDQYSMSIRSRLKLVHEFAMHLINKEVNDIFFDMIRDAPTLNDCKSNVGGMILCKKNSMDVSKSVNPCLNMKECIKYGRFDDLFKIIDSTYIFNNKPYTFQFAIENRAPALDLLRQTNLDPSLGFNYIINIGNNITIDPRGYDPDEEGHNSRGFMNSVYTYSMWKESYNDIYKKIDCNLDNDNKEWCKNHPEDAFISDYLDMPKSFTQSGLYLATGRMASYKVNESDIGLHKLRVDVCDQGGLCDYQVLSILVTDLDSSTNFFPDLPQTFVSLEDPYLLKFSGALGGIIPVKYQFEFFDSNGVSYLIVNTSDGTENYLNLPNDDPKINLIKYGDAAVNINGMTHFFPYGPGEYRVNIKACINNDCSHNIYSMPPSILLKVFNCLPHRESVSALIYPINLSSAFMVTHNCCQGNPADAFLISLPVNWGTYNGTDDICYISKSEYGCNNQPEYLITTPTGLTITPYSSNPYGFPGYPFAELQYKREITVRCSDDRGNTCNGPAIDNRTAVVDCSGACKACGYTNLSFCNISTGTCDNTWKCTGGENIYNLYPTYDLNPTGKFLCQGGCDSSGDCNRSINCKCDIACGATCDLDHSWVWEGNTCTLNCSGMFDINYMPYNEHDDCEFHTSSTTYCAAPDYSSATSKIINLYNLYDGSITTRSVKAGDEDLITNQRIEQSDTTPDTSPISKCIFSDYCYISSCMNDTALNFRGDQCGPTGAVAYIKRLGDYVCFSGNDCTFDATCTSMVAFNNKYPTFISDLSLLSDSPYSVGNDCYFPDGGDYCALDGQWHVGKSSPRPTCILPTVSTCTDTGWKCI